jgi:hypothetical protein
MLREVNGSFDSPNNALNKVARDDKLFLDRNTEPDFSNLSLEQRIRRFAEVHDALNVLYAARAQYDDQWLICQGNELGLAIDELFIANYEHLLLSLRGQLMQAIWHKVVEASKVGGHDEYGKKQRRLLAWFSEFPDSHRPLSTTWPWSIKPSLAVLWGVCWMFYYSQDEQNQINEVWAPDNIAVPQDVFVNQFNWPLPQADECEWY